MFYEQLLKICKINNISPTFLISKLGLSTGNITNWKGGTIPSGEIMRKIATYFNVSVDYLLGNEPFAVSSDNIKLDEIEYALLNEIKDMDSDMKKEILNFAKFKKQKKD